MSPATSAATPFRGSILREIRGFHARSAIALAVATSLAVTPVCAVSAAEAGAPGVVEIEVLSFSSTDAVDEAAALTDAFKHALVGAPGVADHGAGHALEAVALTVGCDDPMAPSCAPKIAEEIKYDKFVYGVVKRSPPNKITATLNYYDGGKVKTVAKTYDGGPLAKDGTSPELKKVALEALFALLGGAPKGPVQIEVLGPASKADGELFEGGKKIGAVTQGKGTVELPSGPHTLELRVPGFASTTSDVEVTPAGTSVQLSPVRLGPEKPIDWQLYGGIAAMGVGAVFVGLGVATSLSIRSSQDDPAFTAYRRRWPSTESDTCERAREGKEGPNPSQPFADKLAPQVASLCDDVSSKQTAQFIYYGLGGALLAGGAVLVLTNKGPGDGKQADKSASAFRLEVKPVVSPNFGSLSLVGTF